MTAAVRDRTTNVVIYLHGDHLGSVSVATTSGGAIASQQEYTPFGSHRGSGDITQTSLDYTGQRLDGTGLLYYHARMYDPALGRFVSADSIVPGAASGAGGGADTLGVDGSSQLKALTVDFYYRNGLCLCSPLTNSLSMPTDAKSAGPGGSRWDWLSSWGVLSAG